MPAPTNDTAKIIAEIQASETRTAQRIAEATAATAVKLDQQTATLLNAIGSGGSTADNTEVLDAIAGVDQHVGKVETDLAAVAQDVKDIEAGIGSGGGSGGGTPPPATVTIPDTQKAWTMADATATPNGTDPGSGQPRTIFTFGVGQDELAINMNASSPSSTANIGAAVYLGTKTNPFMKHIASGMSPTSRAGTNLGDRFLFRGDFMSGGLTLPETEVKIISDPTLSGGWFNGTTLNDAPFETTGNYDGSLKTSEGHIFNSKNVNMDWFIEGTAASGGGTTPPPSTNPPGWGFSDPVYSATEDTVTITVDGQTQTGKFSVLAGAFVAGNEVRVPPGKFLATATVPAIKLIGAVHADGTPATEFSCMGLKPAGSKAVINVSLGHAEISNMILSDAAISASAGENAAGVRTNHDASGANISSATLSNCILRNNQNGFLGPDITFVAGPNGEMSEITGNGRWIAKPGQQHGVYCNGGILSLDHVFIHDNSMRGHEVKCRCDETHLKTLKIITSQNASDSGDFLDVPEGGLVVGDDIDVTTGVGSDHKLWTYAAESANRAAKGKSITLTNFRVHDVASAFAPIMKNGGKIPDATVSLGAGCTYDDEQPTAEAYAAGAVTGTWTKA